MELIWRRFGLEKGGKRPVKITIWQNLRKHRANIIEASRGYKCADELTSFG